MILAALIIAVLPDDVSDNIWNAIVAFFAISVPLWVFLVGILVINIAWFLFPRNKEKHDKVWEYRQKESIEHLIRDELSNAKMYLDYFKADGKMMYKVMAHQSLSHAAALTDTVEDKKLAEKFKEKRMQIERMII